MDDNINEREQDQQMTTDRSVAHLLVSVPEAPSRTKNFNLPSTPTSRMGALTVNGPSGLVITGDPNPNGSPKSLPNQKRDRR
eukprot:5512892-Pleurochrysis_carterae.AAC.1